KSHWFSPGLAHSFSLSSFRVRLSLVLLQKDAWVRASSHLAWEGATMNLETIKTLVGIIAGIVSTVVALVPMITALRKRRSLRWGLGCVLMSLSIAGVTCVWCWLASSAAKPEEVLVPSTHLPGSQPS